MEENAPLDIGTSDDIDTLANHKDNLNNLLTTIEAEKEYTLSIIQIIKNILKIFLPI